MLDQDLHGLHIKTGCGAYPASASSYHFRTFSMGQACRTASVHASLPATMLITAMRTAMPKVTCGRITL
ncbi:MAG TPA: hypothetical protein PLM38_14015, partial [Ottowia sp.]|nr:hypothetical protein [Ottowia sp.]